MSDNTENKAPVNAADPVNTVPETASPEQTTSETAVPLEMRGTVTVTLDGVLKGTFSASGGTPLNKFPGISTTGYTFREPSNSNKEVAASRPITQDVTLVTASRGSGG